MHFRLGALLACWLMCCASLASAQTLRGHVSVSTSGTTWTFTLFNDSGSLTSIDQFDLYGLSPGTFDIPPDGSPTGWNVFSVTPSDTYATWFSSTPDFDVQPPSGTTSNSLSGFVLTFTTMPATPLQYTLTGNDGSTASGLIGSVSYNWDPALTNTASGSGSGTWDTSSANWFVTGANDTAFSNDGTGTAIFGGTAGTYAVSLANAIHLNALTFNTSGYTIDSIASGSLTFDYASPTIVVASGVTGTISTVINASTVSAGNGLIKAGSGTLVLSSAGSAFEGGTTIDDGTLNISSDGALGAGAGSLTFANSGVLQAGGTFTLEASRIIGVTDPATMATFDTQANTLTVASTLSGAGTLSKIGAGVLVLTGNNASFAGDIAVNAGTLQAGNAVGTQFLNALGDTGAHTLTVNAGAMLSLQGREATGPAETIILNGGTLLSNAFNRVGNITLSGGTINTGTGPLSSSFQAISLEGGVTASGTAASLIAPVSGGFNGIHMTGSPAGAAVSFTVNDVTASSASDLTISAPLLDQAGGGGGGLIKTGAGTLMLTGASSYTGGTTVGAGIFAEGANNVLADTGPVTVTGGTFDIGAFSDTLGAVTLQNGSITGTTGTLTGSSYGVQSGTITAILAGAGALAKTTSGTVILSGANTYAGATTAGAGDLRFQSAASLPPGTAVTVASGASIEINAGGAYAQKLTLSGTGSGTAANLGGNTRGALGYYGGGAATDTFSGSISLPVTAAVGSYGTTDVFNFNSVISGSGGLIFNVEGGSVSAHVFTANFNAASTYAGGTVFSSGNGNKGVYVLGVSNALPTTTAVTLAANAGLLQFNLNGKNQTITGLTTSGSASNLANNTVINSSATGATLTINTASADTFGGLLGGAGTNFSLAKSGAGTLVLSGANTYTGGSTINAGTLSGTTSSIPGNVAAGSGAVLDFTQTGNGTYAGSISGAGAVTISGQGTGGGTVSFTSTGSTYTGGTSIVSGTLSGTTGSFGSGPINTGTNSANTLDLQGGTGTLAGNITGSGKVTVGVSGTVSAGAIITLTGTGSYTGGTMVNAGTLSGNTSSYSSGTLTANSGGTIDYTQSGTHTVTNTITGTGAATFGGNPSGGNGTNGVINFTGISSVSSTVSAGTLVLNHAGSAALTGPVSVATGAILSLGSNNQVASTSSVTLKGGRLTANGHSDGAALNGNVTAAGFGRLTLNDGTPAGTPSTLDFGDGSGTAGNVLAFADSFADGTSPTALQWTGTLQVANYTGGIDQFYVGTTNSLTVNQLSRITFQGYSARQLATGEVVFAPEPGSPLALLVGAGTLAALRLRARRRAV